MQSYPQDGSIRALISHKRTVLVMGSELFQRNDSFELFVSKNQFKKAVTFRCCFASFRNVVPDQLLFVQINLQPCLGS